MQVFQQDAATASSRHRRIHAIYAIVYTLVDFLAAILFIVGSVLFFAAETERAGTWMFLIGSIFFAVKPAVTVAREIHYLRIGGLEALETRAP